MSKREKVTVEERIKADEKIQSKNQKRRYNLVAFLLIHINNLIADRDILLHQ